MSLPGKLKPRKAPGQRRAQETVDAIVTAAERILAESGFEAMSTNRIAARAGASIGSIYQYFPHKESILLAVLERHSEREAQHFIARMAELEGKDLRTQVRGLLSIPFEFRRQHARLHAELLAHFERIGRYDEMRNRVRRAAEPLRALVERHVGVVKRKNIDLACHVLVNAIGSLTHEGMLPRPRDVSDEQLVEELTHLVVGYLTD